MSQDRFAKICDLNIISGCIWIDGLLCLWRKFSAAGRVQRWSLLSCWYLSPSAKAQDRNVLRILKTIPKVRFSPQCWWTGGKTGSCYSNTGQAGNFLLILFSSVEINFSPYQCRHNYPQRQPLAFWGRFLQILRLLFIIIMAGLVKLIIIVLILTAGNIFQDFQYVPDSRHLL